MVIQRRRSGQLKVLGHIICNRSQWKDKARTRSDWKIDNQHFATVHINTVDQGLEVLGHNLQQITLTPKIRQEAFGTQSATSQQQRDWKFWHPQSATNHTDTEDHGQEVLGDIICNRSSWHCWSGTEDLGHTICNRSHWHLSYRPVSIKTHNWQNFTLTL